MRRWLDISNALLQQFGSQLIETHTSRLHQFMQAPDKISMQFDRKRNEAFRLIHLALFATAHDVGCLAAEAARRAGLRDEVADPRFLQSLQIGLLHFTFPVDDCDG